MDGFWAPPLPLVRVAGIHVTLFFSLVQLGHACICVVSDAMDRGALQDGARSAPKKLLEIWARGHSLSCVSRRVHAVVSTISLYDLFLFSSPPSSPSHRIGGTQKCFVSVRPSPDIVPDDACLASILNMNLVCACTRTSSFHVPNGSAYYKRPGSWCNPLKNKETELRWTKTNQSPHRRIKAPQGICIGTCTCHRVLLQYYTEKKRCCPSPIPEPRITHTKLHQWIRS